MAMKVINVKTEKVLDADPNIYLQRAEENLKNRQYDEALKEAELAVKYSNNNKSVLEQCNRIKNVVAERYLSTANILINDGYFARSIDQCNKVKNIKGISYEYISKTNELINIANSNIDRRKKADRHLDNANSMLRSGRYNEAIYEAEKALNYMHTSEYMDKVQSVRGTVDYRLREIEASRHIEAARKLLREDKYKEAVFEVNNAMQISKSTSIMHDGKIIKFAVADKFIKFAEVSFENKLYSKCLEQGQLAVNYSGNSDKYVKRFKNLQEAIRIKEIENKADVYIENAKYYMNDMNYYKTLELANKALECSYGTELLDKYLNIYNKIESFIRGADKNDIINLADKYCEVNNYEEAIEWYKIANNGKATYKIGKIEFFKKSNIDLGIDYFEKAANLGYEKAFIELMNLFIEGKYVKRKLKRVKNYYKEFKQINRKLAKQTLKNLKQKYNLSLRKRLIITGRIKLVRYIVLFFILFVLSYSSVMFYDGKWSGYVKEVSFSVNNNTIAINEEGKCTVSYKVIPFFANNKLYKIVPENSSIIDVNGDDYKGLVEGKTNLIVYINDKEYKREEINVYKPRVVDFNISFNNNNTTLNKVGDFITPTINIEYFNDKKVDNVEPIFISNNPKVVRVEGSVLIASGVGNAAVTIKVGEIKKELNFNIQKDYNHKVYDNSYIFKDIDKVYLPLDYLKNTDRNTLTFLVYEVYARHGLIFKEEPYKSYFESKSWYKGTEQAITEDMVNDFEKTNIRLIQARLRDNY